MREMITPQSAAGLTGLHLFARFASLEGADCGLRHLENRHRVADDATPPVIADIGVFCGDARLEPEYMHGGTSARALELASLLAGALFRRVDLAESLAGRAKGGDCEEVVFHVPIIL